MLGGKFSDGRTVDAVLTYDGKVRDGMALPSAGTDQWNTFNPNTGGTTQLTGTTTQQPQTSTNVSGQLLQGRAPSTQEALTARANALKAALEYKKQIGASPLQIDLANSAYQTALADIQRLQNWVITPEGYARDLALSGQQAPADIQRWLDQWIPARAMDTPNWGATGQIFYTNPADNWDPMVPASTQVYGPQQPLFAPYNNGAAWQPQSQLGPYAGQNANPAVAIINGGGSSTGSLGYNPDWNEFYNQYGYENMNQMLAEFYRQAMGYRPVTGNPYESTRVTGSILK